MVLRACVAAPEEVGHPGHSLRADERPGVELQHLQLVAHAAPLAAPPPQFVENDRQHEGVRGLGANTG
eukprot:9135538-Lingulodinium_polyedra.AAC.1